MTEAVTYPSTAELLNNEGAQNRNTEGYSARISSALSRLNNFCLQWAWH